MNLQEELISHKYASSYYLSEAESPDRKKANLEKMMEIINEDISYFIHPLITVEVKKIILSKLADSEIKKTSAFRLCEVLVSNGRIKLLNTIYSKFVEIYLESNGFSKVDVQAKFPLSEEEKNRINHMFVVITGKKAMINFQKDENIIGGFILRWSDKIVDLTIDKRIKSLREEIEKEL